MQAQDIYWVRLKWGKSYALYLFADHFDCGRFEAALDEAGHEYESGFDPEPIRDGQATNELIAGLAQGGNS